MAVLDSRKFKIVDSKFISFQECFLSSRCVGLYCWCIKILFEDSHQRSRAQIRSDSESDQA